MSAPNASFELDSLTSKSVPIPNDLLLLADFETSTPQFFLKKTTVADLAPVILAEPWRNDSDADDFNLRNLESLLSNAEFLPSDGFIRMGEEDLIKWKNVENTADISLTVGLAASSNNLVLSGADGFQLDLSSNIFWGNTGLNRISSDGSNLDIVIVGVGYQFTATAFDVKGKNITDIDLGIFQERSEAPDGTGDTAKLYSREDGTITKLFYVDSNGTEIGPLGEAGAAALSASAATLAIGFIETGDGTVKLIATEFVGTGITDVTPGTGRFKLSGNIFQLNSSIAITGNSAQAQSQWQSADDIDFTGSVTLIGRESNSSASNTVGSAPIATAFVDARTQDVFVRLISSNFLSSPTIVLKGTWGQIFSIGSEDTGDVNGPGSSTPRAIAIWADANGDALLDTSVIIDTNNSISGIQTLTTSTSIQTPVLRLEPNPDNKPFIGTIFTQTLVGAVDIFEIECNGVNTLFEPIIYANIVVKQESQIPTAEKGSINFLVATGGAPPVSMLKLDGLNNRIQARADLIMGANEIQFDSTTAFISQVGTDLRLSVDDEETFSIVIESSVFTFGFGEADWKDNKLLNMGTLSFGNENNSLFQSAGGSDLKIQGDTLIELGLASSPATLFSFTTILSAGNRFPIITTEQEDTTPATGPIFSWFYNANSDAGVTTFARMEVDKTNIGDGTENGSIIFSAMSGGSLRSFVRLNGAELKLDLLPGVDITFAKNISTQGVLPLATDGNDDLTFDDDVVLTTGRPIVQALGDDEFFFTESVSDDLRQNTIGNLQFSIIAGMQPGTTIGLNRYLAFFNTLSPASDSGNREFILPEKMNFSNLSVRIGSNNRSVDTTISIAIDGDVSTPSLIVTAGESNTNEVSANQQTIDKGKRISLFVNAGPGTGTLEIKSFSCLLTQRRQG